MLIIRHVQQFYQGSLRIATLNSFSAKQAHRAPQASLPPSLKGSRGSNYSQGTENGRVGVGLGVGVEVGAKVSERQ